MAGRRIGGFSLGMAQRLGIAAALLGDPRTLLFDEPVNGLDPEGIRWIRTLMRRLASEGRTVVVSSHLMNEMEETADHVIVIGRGRLIADTSMAEFRRRSASSHVHVVSPDAARLHELLERAGGDGAAVTATRHGTPALTVSGLEAGADRRPRRRARAARARAHAAQREPRDGVHGAHPRQRRLPAGGRGMSAFARHAALGVDEARRRCAAPSYKLAARVRAVGRAHRRCSRSSSARPGTARAPPTAPATTPSASASFGSLFSTIVFAVLGATAVTKEYSSGMMRLTLTATPRRGRVLAAKAAVVAGLTLVAGLVTAVMTFLVAQAVFAAYGVPTAGLGDGDALRTVLGDGVLTPVLPVIAVALGFATRSTAGRGHVGARRSCSCRGSSAACCRPGGRTTCSTYLPGAAAEAITSGHLDEASSSLLSPGVAALVLAGWVALFLAAAWAVFERRDA